MRVKLMLRMKWLKGNTKMKDGPTHEHYANLTGRYDRAGRQKRSKTYRQEGRQLADRDERETDRKGQMGMQTAWLDGKSWESGGQTWRWLPGDQTAGLMICSRHSQCETGRLPPPRSAAPAPRTHSLTTNLSLPLSRSVHLYCICFECQCIVILTL